MKRILLLAGVAILCMSAPAMADENEKHRVIVLTDMGADPDDQQSLVRLLLYANQIDLEGLVATTSVWHRDEVNPEYITRILDAYGAVQPNLLEHEPGYPQTAELMSRVKRGLPEYGMDGVGDGKDSEGSDWIIEVLERDDSRPLWISVWGGANTLAQALYTIDKTRPDEEAKRLVSKLRVYTISDQDDSGAWMRRTFPSLFYIVSPGDDYGSATWSSINHAHEGIDSHRISNAWLAENIQQGHGPLGTRYPDTAWGFEGDTPAYLMLIPNGLNAPEHPDWGGWGGRYELRIPEFSSIKEGGSDVIAEPETRPIWTDTSDSLKPYSESEYGRFYKPVEQEFSGNKVTLWRWRDDFQNDFAARMDWSTQPYAQANHPPVPVLSHSTRIKVKSGERFEMNASGSSDPDGDSLSYLWFNYPEAGSLEEPVEIQGAENEDHASVVAPEVEQTETLHFILRLTDKGSPRLSRYQRVIVTVTP